MKLYHYVIRKCTSDDAEGRGVVHYQSWQETYRGLMPDEFLDELDQKKLIQRAKDLVKAVINKLSNENLVLYVLEGNNQAINFYKYLGFSFTGISMEQQVSGGVIKELEMVLKIRNCL